MTRAIRLVVWPLPPRGKSDSKASFFSIRLSKMPGSPQPPLAPQDPLPPPGDLDTCSPATSLPHSNLDCRENPDYTSVNGTQALFSKICASSKIPSRLPETPVEGDKNGSKIHTVPWLDPDTAA
jgi:hypothetical protein